MYKLLMLFIAATLSLLVLTSCNQTDRAGSAENGDSLKGKISISGAFALYPLTVRWAEEYQKLHPRVTINISAGGAGKGMADALSHMVDLGMYSKEVSDAERKKGAWALAVAKDAVLPTINSNNPVLAVLEKKGMTRALFNGVFISGKITTWGQAAGTSSKDPLQAFTRSDACGAAEMWARYLGASSQEDLQGLGVNGDPGVADAIRRNVYGIGYNNLNFCYDMETRQLYPGLAVIPIDINENGAIDAEENFYGSLDEVMKAIMDGRYPSPPARELYLVAAGQPSKPVVVAFLRWILTDGQKYLNEAGYIALPDEKISSEKTKLQKH